LIAIKDAFENQARLYWNNFMPKIHHCWRCKILVPMLTDEEWGEIHLLIRFDTEWIKTYRADTGASVHEANTALNSKALDRYFEITGFRETNINALYHHHLSLYGDECVSCGHLLRTPQSSFCANCGQKKT
jgi:hypothetical protein